MPQAYVDPEELERFANDLKQFNDELRSRSSHLQGQFARLHNAWRDREQAHFAQEFQQTMQQLQRFISLAEVYAPFLSRKARRARAYFSSTKGGAAPQSPSVDVYRVQGGQSRERISVTTNGNIEIHGEQTLYLNFNQKERAMNFYMRRGEQAYIVQFKVKEDFLDYLRSIAVDEREARMYPDRPHRCDPGYPDQFGLHSNLFGLLKSSIIPGSAKEIKSVV